MLGLNFGIKIVTIALILRHCHFISVGSHDGTAEILWNLSHLALQKGSTVNTNKSVSEFQLHPEKFSKYTGPIKYNKKINPDAKTMSSAINRDGYQYYTQNFRPPLPAHLSGYQQYSYQQSIMVALQIISQNDQLQCIPRLLCELISGPNSEPNKKDTSSFLPFNLDISSIVGLVSAIGGAQSNPLLHFGRAALLGYSSKGNARTCTFAYPECPQDPDVLVEYLNNYNGGFFRFFNGLREPQHVQQQQIENVEHLTRPSHLPAGYGYYPYPQNRITYAQKRILNQPENDYSYYQQTKYHNLRFPSEHESETVEENKGLFGFFNGIKYNRPRKENKLNNIFNGPHVSIFFPDRTGTGELKLDPDEFKFNVNYRDESFSHQTVRFPSLSLNNHPKSFVY